MTNNFVKSVMDNKHNLYVAATFSLFGTHRSCKFKIDTGCNYTCIPVKRLNVSDDAARKLKQQALDNGIPYTRSYGVSDTEQIKENDKKQLLQGKHMECTSLKFQHKIHDFVIGNCNLGTTEIGINYDRIGNILLGMDILKDWDIHIGRLDNGQTIFLGCPKEQINSDYLFELERLLKQSIKVNVAILEK